MKILSVTTLFPSRAQPVHAVFVHNRIKHVAELLKDQGEVRVIAPIPYFPFDRLIAKYAERHKIPRADQLGRLAVLYPRYLSIPVILKPLDGFFVLLAVWRVARKLRQEFEFDLIDAHLAFPDGFAGVFLAWHWPVGLLVLAVWLAMAFAFRISSLAALTASLLAPLAAWFFDRADLVFPAALIAAAIWFNHRANIVRLSRREEPKINLSKQA